MSHLCEKYFLNTTNIVSNSKNRWALLQPAAQKVSLVYVQLNSLFFSFCFYQVLIPLLVCEIFQFGPQGQKKLSIFCILNQLIAQIVNFTKKMFFKWSAELI
jgi:hypothetical protein